MLTSIKTALVMATLSLAAAGCIADAGGEEGQSDQDDAAGERVGAAEQAFGQGWTNYTSDEKPPAACDALFLMNQAQCSGKYCDNVRAWCDYTGLYPDAIGGSQWTSYFSEETAGDTLCGSNEWVTGIACKGSYCDNVSLQCTQIWGVSKYDCHWTGWISDEHDALQFGEDYYMVGAKCSGRYCDNMNFRICKLIQP